MFEQSVDGLVCSSPRASDGGGGIIGAGDVAIGTHHDAPIGEGTCPTITTKTDALPSDYG